MSGTPAVYIVDDDEPVRDSFRILMETFGIPVHTFVSAEDFLASCNLEWIGILFVDLRMPGMGGLQLIERLDALGSRLDVVVVSGHMDEERFTESSGSYPALILEKPFAVERLREILARTFPQAALNASHVQAQPPSSSSSPA